MKAVIFAGGLGTRMREETELKPKPMVEIGGKPVLWHLMKIYSHHGVNDFVILAGYKAQVIKDYFLNLGSNTRDFIVETGNRQGEVEFLSGSEEKWKVAILDTGIETLTGERLLKARQVIGEEPFHCTYGDGLAAVDLGQLEELAYETSAVGTMTVTRPTNRFGLVEYDENLKVTAFREKPRMSNWVNMGFFFFTPGIFENLRDGEALEDGALSRLARSGTLAANPHNGFWEPMDTFREYKMLQELWDSSAAPWKLW